MKHIENWVLHNFGARIDNLKKEGYQFRTEWESSTNRYKEKVEYKRYYLVDDIIAENMEHITV